MYSNGLASILIKRVSIRKWRRFWKVYINDILESLGFDIVYCFCVCFKGGANDDQLLLIDFEFFCNFWILWGVFN